MDKTVSALDKYVESWTPGPLTDEDPMQPDPASAVSALRNQHEVVACGTPSEEGADLHVATHRDPRHVAAEVTFA